MRNSIKFLLCAGLAFACIPLFSQNYNLELRSSLTIPDQTLANICGYTQNGREYALLGASKGMVIVDITNPDAPTQIVQIPGPDNLWKEIKVYEHYAYVTSEGGQGLQIIDLSPLPSATLPSHFYTGDGAIDGPLNKIHALHIDVTKGFVYLYGGDVSLGGAKVLDLKNDPYNPKYVGKFDQLGYIHDGYVDNDTMYAAHINAGILSIVDMTNKSNPKLLGTIETPARYTHNSWILSDRKHILTTDETTPSFVTAYDVSNPEDIRELDRISTTREGTNSIGHNTHVLNDWAITSWYTDGVTIIDAHRPDNLVEVARYDTWLPPLDPSNFFQGCWGAYPYFPSGTIVTSNMVPGVLNVFTPTYVRACYLEGTVLNSCNGFPLSGVSIEVNTSEVRVNTTTKTNGVFKTGQVTPGNYTATISKPGFVTQTIDFAFVTGEVTPMNLSLVPIGSVTLGGIVVDASTGSPLANVSVNISSPLGNTSLVTDADGQYSVECLPTSLYSATVAAWGYSNTPIQLQNNQQSNINVAPLKYYDDFLFDLGWEKSSNAASGDWELGEPLGTYNNDGNEVNPESDASGDNNDQCYVTGNGGGAQGSDDVDDGSVTLTTPPMQLAEFSSANLSFYYWFYNGGGNGSPNDHFNVNVLVDGQSFPVFTQTESASQWRFSGIIPMPAAALSSNNVRVEFIASDDNPGHVVEAGLDIFKVEVGAVGVSEHTDATAQVIAMPNPSGSSFRIQYNWENAAELPLLEVRNLLGQVVFAQNLDAKSGAVSCGNNWTPGIYFATLRSGNMQATPLKLVRQ